MNKRLLGTQYEDIACDMLKRHGYEILHRNYRCKMGEVDIIYRDGEVISFTEVKYRGSKRYGSPEEAVSYMKMMRIRSAAKSYIREQGLDINTPVRFDMIAIDKMHIKLYINAF